MSLFGPVRYLSGSLRNILFLILTSGSLILFIFQQQYSVDLEINSLLTRVEELKQEQKQLLPIYEPLHRDVNETMGIVTSLSKQIETLEQNSKRNNLIFYGVFEEKDENLIEIIKTFLKTKLKLSVGDGIDYAYRMKDENSPRPILVKFTRWKDKTKIFYKRKSLSSDDVTIEEDLTESQKKRLKMLKEYGREAERNGKKTRWSGKKLFVDGEQVDL